LAGRLARPLSRWDRARLETPEIAVPVAGLPAGLEGYRLALVTDLHHGPAVPTWWLGRMADRVGELDADLVVLGGDFVSHARSDMDGLERVLTRFRGRDRSEEHTSELQSPYDLVCRLLLEKKKK